MATPDTLQNKINDHMKNIAVSKASIRDQLIGRNVKIISNFNGQPYGHSKPSLKGTIFKIKDIVIDRQIELWDGDYNHCFININEVEVIE